MRTAVQSPPFAGVLDLGPDGLLRVVMAPHDRNAISKVVDKLIDLLDAMDGDPDQEADYWLYGEGGVTSDHEPSLGWNWRHDGSPVVALGDGGDDREEEDEHGGDILDEPHDGEDFEF